MLVSKQDYESIKESSIEGRYVTHSMVSEFINKHQPGIHKTKLGSSVEKRPIELLQIGKGKTRILMWSQMHGNEATTTKALLDLVNYLSVKSSLANTILENCTLFIVPMLNPDGAQNYTRENANGVDLNRDAQALTQPESILLNDAYSKIAPHFCFNLHDQRTIYNVGKSAKPASLSFLAPSHNHERSVSASRKLSMQLIIAIVRGLGIEMEEQIARYDDAFNPNCIGDAIQLKGIPVVLFEAGHFQEDYEREISRYYVFHALLLAISAIAHNDFRQYDIQVYYDIPENNKRFYDVLLLNVDAIDPNAGSGDKAGILFKEILEEGRIKFVPYIQDRGLLENYFGHKTYDCSNTIDLNLLQKTSLLDLLKI